MLYYLRIIYIGYCRCLYTKIDILRYIYCVSIDTGICYLFWNQQDELVLKQRVKLIMMQTFSCYWISDYCYLDMRR